MIRSQIEEGPGACRPVTPIPAQVEQLVKVLVVAIDDQHVTIAARAARAGIAAFDPVRLRDGFVGNG